MKSTLIPIRIRYVTFLIKKEMNQISIYFYVHHIFLSIFFYTYS